MTDDRSFPRAAYVHVPFCVHRCGYCDFTVIAGRDDLIEAYLDCLEREIQSTLADPRQVDTLFVGGGTPSYLPADKLEQFTFILKQWLPLSAGGEWSMECNPDGFTPDRMDVLAAAGVNRISLGVQSFDRNQLLLLERQHDPETVADVVANLRARRFSNLSLDLIFGVPGQSLADWSDTLRAAIALRPQHLSTYGLTFEKGTSFWNRREKGDLTPAPDELERAMYAEAMDVLPAQGFRHYEISNFALPGWECRHNQVYWQAQEYFGFGPGAAGYRRQVRTMNTRSVTGWIQRVQSGQSSVQEQEALTAELLASEAVMLGLRQIDGIGLADFESRFGRSVKSLAPDAYERFLDDGLLQEADNAVKLTPAGRFLADTVACEFL